MSRLERLFTLLETGSNPAIRKAAAQQIGEVQRLHPHDLQTLCENLHTRLLSKDWDTRIAAGQALEAIASNVPLWIPNADQQQTTTTTTQQNGAAIDMEEFDLQFDTFDIQKVLANGALLLSSGGQEYDVPAAGLAGLDPKEALKKQKRKIRKQLGLEASINDDIDLIDDDDLIVNTKTAIPDKKEDISTVLDTTGMSARERNKAKRKAKSSAKEKEAPQKRYKEMSTQPQNSDKIVLESILDVDKAYNHEEWPFTPIYEDLLLDLFNAQWEVRHGAAVGLREVCRRHGAGGGTTVHTPVDKLSETNARWLDDFAIRLLCVIALDRFGDFVSDQVVAPVRETCAQVLGIAVKFMSEQSVHRVLDVLLHLQESRQWEVRHGGLLGIKYVVVVRLDLVASILPRILDAITRGLRDRDDDVRATASETFQPLARALVERHIDRLHDILTILWDILLELDDLAVSTASVLNLLADLYAFPQVLPTPGSQQAAMAPPHPHVAHSKLAHLVPRLYTFFRHNLASVRLAAIRTVERLITATPAEARTHWLLAIAPDLLRHTFQNILLEERTDIVDISLATWNALLGSFGPSVVRGAALPYLVAWVTLLATNPGTPYNAELLLAPPARTLEISASQIGKKRQKTVEGAPKNEAFLSTRSKVIGSSAVGTVVRMWPTEFIGELQDMFFAMARSTSAIQRHLACLVLSEAATMPLPPDMARTLAEALEEAEPSWHYAEAESIIRSKLHSDARVLAQSISNAIPNVGQWPASILQWLTNEPIDPLRVLPCAIDLVSNGYSAVIGKVQKSAVLDQLEARRKTILSTIGYIDKLQRELHTLILSGIDGLLIVANAIPAKVTPVIRSLLHSIRNEEDEIYQKRTAASLANFVELCVTRKPCPNEKLVRSMFSVLCEDPTDTPQASLHLQSFLKLEEPLPVMPTDPEDARTLRLGRRGAGSFFAMLAQRFGDRLYTSLPFFNALMTSRLAAVWSTTQQSFDEIRGDADRLQGIIDELQLIRNVAPSLDRSFHPELATLVPLVFHVVKLPNAAVQTMAARCIAQLCQTITLPAMHHLIEHLLPLLGDSRSLASRSGAIATVLNVLEELGMTIVPYIVFLAIPVLGCMSDQDTGLRKTASLCFAKLVKLMPLEAGVASPEGLDPRLAAQRLEERKFLEQLLDGSKVEQYSLPMRINTELRKYQQDGVNWLAFLNKYKLHGILCDDMGLGKTLQAICIMAGDDYDRAVKYAAQPTPNNAPLPSMVVCPSTLVGHWYHEIKRFCDASMRPLTYHGNPAERAALRLQFSTHNVLIVSYDIVRNDIEHLSAMHFNYCILDEGHIIKNAKTKLTQAVKQIQSNHRLILSGTPIQNNVLELWSLFDFLMPGFLGSERQFEETYSKPILNSKDPKCTQRDQEAGALAMEGLHRQVLPFLLRRLKENVLHDLPPKIIQDRYCKLSPLQIRLYDDFSKTHVRQEIDSDIQDADEESEEDTKTKGKKKGGATHIFQALQYLRKLCSHPMFVLNQDHPRYNAITRDLKAAKSDIHDLEHAPKLATLKELLLECGIGVHAPSTANDLEGGNQDGHRVLIFAQMKSMLDAVETDLFKRHLPGVTYLRMDGATDPMKRHSIVNQFNSDPTIDVLLLTTHVGGLGLNLTGADTVIFLEHDWNPMKDLQAMDRAHRIGQKKVVNVYRLITSGTLEEKIMGLQRFKLNIANTVVNQDNQSLQTMSTNELLNLFDYNESADNNSNAASDGLNSMGQVEKASTNKGGLKNVLDTLGDLWDESQYTEEFNLNNFIGSLS
eukprot:gene248-301_t